MGTTGHQVSVLHAQAVPRHRSGELGHGDDPPGFRVFREAAVNLLIHQDCGDHSRKSVIKFYRDGIQFWNPGDVFGDDTRLWEPGEKEVRNPSIAMAMRRIAMCEQAGTGMRMMREAWRKLGHPSPIYKNDRAAKGFLRGESNSFWSFSFHYFGDEPFRYAALIASHLLTRPAQESIIGP